MADMQFLEELRDFLREERVIYTVRKYKMAPKLVHVEGVGSCRRVPMGEITGAGDLAPYYTYSGFPTMGDWWAKVRSFIAPGEPMYLYRVEVEEEDAP